MSCPRALAVLAPAMLLVAGACGRRGFDDAAPDAGGGGGGIQPIHEYLFESNTSDERGGASLFLEGGEIGDGVYSFGPNQGLLGLAVMPRPPYTIDADFVFERVAGYNKIVDFKNRGSDAGLYVWETALRFVRIADVGCDDPASDHCSTSSPGLFAVGGRHQVTFTHDAAGHGAGYVDHQLVLEYDDPTGSSLFDEPNADAWWFEDDTKTNVEAAAGAVYHLRIYDVALTAAQLPPP